MYKNYKIKNFNFRILIYIVILCAISYLAIGSAVAGNDNAGLENKQLVGVVIGMVLMLGLTFIDYHIYLKIFALIHLIDIGLLLIVRFAGKSSKGAKRWIKIGGTTIQPSELSKIMLILVMAALMGLLYKKINKIWAILVILGVCSIVWFLLYKQPDLSTTMVCVFLFAAMIFMAGISYKWVLGVLGVGSAGVAWLMFSLLNDSLPENFLEQYQRNRILSFIDPGKYADMWYQQEYSIIAIGSGGLTGKGLNNDSYASVKTGNYLSEAQTDFIFTIVGEEMGFIGCCAVIILLLLIILECFIIASKAVDLEGKLIAGSMGALIAFQSFINVAVATGMMPNTGIPLPFMSAGLSSLVSMFIGIGIVLNVGMVKNDHAREIHERK